jgi:hypothetical protein
MNDRGHPMIFASGTPLSNSIAELFTISRFLQPDQLETRDIQYFDNWINTFAESEQMPEYKPEGGGYRTVTKFKRFVNVPDLTEMVYQVMDSVKGDDVLKGRRPDSNLNKVVVPQNKYVEALMQDLGDRAKDIRNDPQGALDKDPPDIMLRVTTDGRKIAMDVRMKRADLPDSPETKANYATKEVVKLYEESKAYKGVQLVFADLGTPNSDGRFSVYADMKEKLIAAGVKADDIAFIHDAKTDVQRAKLFDKVNAGTIRVLFGSTEKLGTGVNVQERVIAMHHLDTQWNFANWLQRNGRGVRQGNEAARDHRDNMVEIFAYTTAKSVDAFMWDKTASKGRLLGQVMSGKVTSRVVEDISQDVMGASEMVAVTADNPLILKRVVLENEINGLEASKEAHASKIFTVKRQIKETPNQIEVAAYNNSNSRKYIKAMEELTYIWVEEAPIEKDKSGKVTKTGEKVFDLSNDKERKAVEGIMSQGRIGVKARLQNEDGSKYRELLFKEKGFSSKEAAAKKDAVEDAYLYDFTLKGQYPAGIEIGINTKSFATDLNSVKSRLESSIERNEKEISDLKENLPRLEESVKEEFGEHEELKDKRDELEEIIAIFAKEEAEEREAAVDIDDVKTTNEKLDALIVEDMTEEERQKWEEEREDVSLGQGEAPDQTVSNIGNVRKRVEDLARQMVPSVNVEMVDQLFAEGDPVVRSGGFGEERTEVAGKYRGAENLIQVALNFGDPESTIRHEAIHALKRGGFFKEDEWALLEREAGLKWKDAYDVKDTEESIAYAFGDFRAGGKFLPKYRRIFARIRNFLRRMGNMVRGMGFQTAEDIFGKVEYGTVAKREDGTPVGDKRANPEWLKEQLSLGKQAVRGNELQEAAITRTQGVVHKPIVASMYDAIKRTWNNKGEVFRQGLVDQYAAWETLEKGENAGELLDATESAYKAMRMTQNLHSVMASILRHGPLQYIKGGFKVKKSMGGFEAIFEPLAKAGKLRLWKGWAMANRAQRLKREDREKLMTDGEIVELLKLGAEHPEFQGYMDKWTAFNKEMLNMAEAAGLINAEQRAVWEHSDYVPFYRILDGDMIAGTDRGKGGIQGQRSGIRKLTGGESQVNDIIENMVMNMSSMTDRAMKNVAAQRAVALGLQTGTIEKAAPNIRSAIVLGKPTMKAVDEKVDEIAPEKIHELAMALDEINEELNDPELTDKKKATLERQAEQAETELENWTDRMGFSLRGVPSDMRKELLKTLQLVPPSEPDIISVMVDGKPEYYRVLDPMLYNGITSLSPMQLGGVMKIFRMSKRLLTEGVTMDPAFMLANVIRDTMSAFVITGKTSPLGVMGGFAKALREDTSLVSIMAAGGGSGGFYRTDPQDVSKIISTKLRKIDKRTILDSPKKLWEAWHKVGAASEAANRIAIFDKVKKQGGTDSEAAYQALNLLDFSMRGEWKAVRLLIEMVPFLNARMQGLYRLGEGFNENRTAFVLRGGIIMGATMALLAANWDDPRYEELDEWDKDTYYHFWIDGQHYRLPKGFEVGAIFSTIPERLMRFATGKDTTREAAVSVLRMFSETFAFNPTPQLLHPIIEEIANRKFFTGSTIVPLGLEKLDPEAQHRPWTSEAAVAAGELTGASPLRIQHVINGYLGSMGGYLLSLADAGVRLGTDKPVEPELRFDEIPVWKRFVRSDPPRSTKFKTEFYRLKRDAAKAYNTVRDYRNRGMAKDAKEFLAANRDRVATYKGLHRAGLAMSEMNKAMRSIQESRTMNAGEKRRRIDLILKRQNELSKRMVAASKRIKDRFDK